MASIRVTKVSGARIEARTESIDPSVPASGRLLAVARKTHGGDDWCVRVAGDEQPRFMAESAALAFLATVTA